MRKLIFPAAMRDMEKRYFAETGTPSIALMERAARALTDILLRRYGANKRIYIACGPGGNGGDGYACARLYTAEGGQCALFPVAPPTTPDTTENLHRARVSGIPEYTLQDAPEPPDIWVDALFGTGLSRAPQGASAALIERMNADRARGSVVIAVDIPSGLDGTTGTAYTPCVRADVTCTFQFAKTGHWLADGLDVCGEIEVPDIGIPKAFHPNSDAMVGLMEAEDVRSALPPLLRNIHKGKNGRLLIVAGSVGMAGAAVLCAQSALRSGAGLVTVACPISVLPIVQTLAPCAMGLPLPERKGAIAPEAGEVLKQALENADSAVCGCGLSRRAAPEVLAVLLHSDIPALLDADALNLIADNASLKSLLQPHHLITPHPGEAARLLGRRVSDPVRDAFILREAGCQVLLKGTTSVIPVEGQAWLSSSGAGGMAKGGSGDCLSGLTGGLMARFAAEGNPLNGGRLAMCAALGSEIHGHAGELAQNRLGARGMCAGDIVESLPQSLMDYERFCL